MLALRYSLGESESCAGTHAGECRSALQEQGRVDTGVLQRYSPGRGLLQKSRGRVGEKKSRRRNEDEGEEVKGWSWCEAGHS